MATTTYATVAEAKTRLGLTGSSQDANLAIALEAASRSIDNYCGRRFWADDVATPRVFDTELSDLLWIPDAAPVLTVTPVVESDSTGDGQWDTTWTLDARTGYGYTFLPRLQQAEEAEVVPYTQIRALSGSWPVGFGAVRVTAVYGWDAVPGPIKDACLLWTTRLWKRKDAVLGVAGDQDVGFLELARRMDPDIRHSINPYRRVSVLAVGG